MFKFSLTPRHLFALVSLSLLVMLQGCFHSKDSAPGPDPIVPDQDASGIYTGSAELNTSPKVMPDDLKGMVYDNHFYIFSVNQHVLYEGTITGITGNDVTGTVDVYVDGELQDNDATMTGSVTTESQMSLTINGTLKGSGTLTLTYDGIYKRGATLERILTTVEATWWNGNAYAKTDSIVLFEFISMTDAFAFAGGTGPYNCVIEIVTGATFTIPSENANIYQFNQYEIYHGGAGCTYVGTGFNGYAAAVDNGGTDNELWAVLTNGTYSVFSVVSR